MPVSDYDRLVKHFKDLGLNSQQAGENASHVLKTGPDSNYPQEVNDLLAPPPKAKDDGSGFTPGWKNGTAATDKADLARTGDGSNTFYTLPESKYPAALKEAAPKPGMLMSREEAGRFVKMLGDVRDAGWEKQNKMAEIGQFPKSRGQMETLANMAQSNANNMVAERVKADVAVGKGNNPDHPYALAGNNVADGNVPQPLPYPAATGGDPVPGSGAPMSGNEMLDAYYAAEAAKRKWALDAGK
jgi:hypothetical protein